MTTQERTSISIPTERYETYLERLEEIKRTLGASSNSEAIVELVFMFERLRFESEMYKRFIKDAQAYESRWERKHGKAPDSIFEII